MLKRFLIGIFCLCLLGTHGWALSAFSSPKALEELLALPKQEVADACKGVKIPSERPARKPERADELFQQEREKLFPLLLQQWLVDFYKETTWAEFLQENTAMADEMAARLNCTSYLIQQADLGQDLVNKIIEDHEVGRPDYGAETKGMRYVYVTDSSDHGTQTIVAEVERVMRAVREANPQARILLAMEFAVNIEFGASPIRFAGKENKTFWVHPEYQPLVTLADELKMDTLALDDYVVWENAFKMGKNLVFVDESAQSADIIKDKDIGYALNFAGATLKGVAERNNQWASYLKIMEPFYDITIVYTGGGHTSYEGTLNPLPAEVGTEFALFNFYTMEELPEKSQEFYAQRFADVTQYGKEEKYIDGINNLYTSFQTTSEESIKKRNEQFGKTLNNKEIIYFKNDKETEALLEDFVSGDKASLEQADLLIGNGLVTQKSKSFDVILPDFSL